jgi:hypothetical protein
MKILNEHEVNYIKGRLRENNLIDTREFCTGNINWYIDIHTEEISIQGFKDEEGEIKTVKSKDLISYD